MLPVGLQWSPRSGVTLLGDTAHLMTPFAGVGVNVALTDAPNLSRALLKRKDNFEADLPGNLTDAPQEHKDRCLSAREQTWRRCGVAATSFQRNWD